MLNFDKEDKILIDELAKNLENKDKELQKIGNINTNLQSKLQNTQVIEILFDFLILAKLMFYRIIMKIFRKKWNINWVS